MMSSCWKLRNRKRKAQKAQTRTDSHDEVKDPGILAPPVFRSNAKLMKAAASGDSDEIKNLMNLLTNNGSSKETARNTNALWGTESDTIGIALCGTDSRGCTALHVAVAKGHEHATKTLVELGGPLNAQDKFGWTAAHTAVASDHHKCLHILLNSGADPNAVVAKGTSKGKTLLQLAVEHGSVESLRILIEIDATVTIKSSDMIGMAMLNSSKKLRNNRTLAIGSDTLLRNRLNAAKIIQTWWRKTYVVRYKKLTEAAIKIQTRYRTHYIQKWFLQVLRQHREANVRVAEFDQIRRLCMSDETHLEMTTSIAQYLQSAVNLDKLVTLTRQKVDSFNKKFVPKATNYYSSPQFYKKVVSHPIFIRNAPTSEGKIVGVLGDSDKIVIKAHSSRSEAETDDGKWMQVANPICVDSGTHLYGPGKAWCLMSLNQDDTTVKGFFIHQEFVDYTAMNSLIPLEIEIANLQRNKKAACAHYYPQATHGNSNCMFCGQQKPQDDQESLAVRHSNLLQNHQVPVKSSPLSFDEIEKMIKHLPQRSDEELLAEAVAGHAQKNLIFLCNNTSASVVKVCDRLGLLGFQKVYPSLDPHCGKGHTPEISGHAGIIGRKCSDGHNGGCMKRWLTLSNPTILQAMATKGSCYRLLDSVTSIRFAECQRSMYPCDIGWSPILLATQQGLQESAVLLITRFGNCFGNDCSLDLRNGKITRQLKVFNAVTNIAIVHGYWNILEALKAVGHDFQLATEVLGGITRRLSEILPRESNLNIPTKLARFSDMLKVWVHRAKVQTSIQHCQSTSQEIRKMLDLGFEIDSASENGLTALMFAARRNVPWLVKLLLDCGADIRSVDVSGHSVWWHAADGNAVGSLELLVEHWRASLHNQSHHPKYSCDRGGLVSTFHDHWDESNATPLATALRNVHFAAAEYLISLGCSVGDPVQFDGLIRKLVHHSDSGARLAKSVLFSEVYKIISVFTYTCQQPKRLAAAKEGDSALSIHKRACKMLTQIISALNHFEEDLFVRKEVNMLLLKPEVQKAFLVEVSTGFGSTEFWLADQLPWHLESHAREYLLIARGRMINGEKLLPRIATKLHPKVLKEYWQPVVQELLNCKANKLVNLAECIIRLEPTEQDEARTVIADELPIDKIIKDQYSPTVDLRNEACDFIRIVFPDKARLCDVCYYPIHTPTKCCQQTGGEHYKKVDCTHEFCKGCLEQWIKQGLDGRQIQIRCPDGGCKFVFSGDDVKRIAGSMAYDQFVNLGNESYKERIKEVVADPLMQKYLDTHTRVCPNCSVIIERSEGCNSMRCPCGHSFQWTTAHNISQAHNNNVL